MTRDNIGKEWHYERPHRGISLGLSGKCLRRGGGLPAWGRWPRSSYYLPEVRLLLTAHLQAGSSSISEARIRLEANVGSNP